MWKTSIDSVVIEERRMFWKITKNYNAEYFGKQMWMGNFHVW